MFKCKISPDYVMDPKNNGCAYEASGNLVCPKNAKIIPVAVTVAEPPKESKAVEGFFQPSSKSRR
jgi:hypothetical protein